MISYRWFSFVNYKQLCLLISHQCYKFRFLKSWEHSDRIESHVVKTFGKNTFCAVFPIKEWMYVLGTYQKFTCRFFRDSTSKEIRVMFVETCFHLKHSRVFVLCVALFSPEKIAFKNIISFRVCCGWWSYCKSKNFPAISSQNLSFYPV